VDGSVLRGTGLAFRVVVEGRILSGISAERLIIYPGWSGVPRSPDHRDPSVAGPSTTRPSGRTAADRPERRGRWPSFLPPSAPDLGWLHLDRMKISSSRAPDPRASRGRSGSQRKPSVNQKLLKSLNSILGRALSILSFAVGGRRVSDRDGGCERRDHPRCPYQAYRASIPA